MQRFFITLLMIMLSVSTLAQTTPVPLTSPASVQTNASPSASDESPSIAPADRVETECRDWAVQDGVPENELADYVKECVEDRAVQE